MEDYERVILVKPEAFVYRIPPRTTNRAYRAAEWKLDSPDWSGRLRILSQGAKCVIKLEDKNSGELFASCPVDAYPSAAVESVSDSARYFVLRIKDDSNRTAFIGVGFVDRSDSFDFNVALQDHFKLIKKEEELAKNPPAETDKKLDLSFKEGQTIKINIGKKTETSTGVARQKPQSGLGSGGILLPPPPSKTASSSNTVKSNLPPISASAFANPAAPTNTTKPVTTTSTAQSDLLLDFGMTSNPAPVTTATSSWPNSFTTNNAQSSTSTSQKDEWADFLN